MIQFECPSCRKPFRVAPEHAGKTARCRCGAAVQIPAAEPVPVLAFAGAALESPCPSCQAPMASGDVLCVRCGFNRVTGVKVALQAEGDDPTEEVIPRRTIRHAKDPDRWLKRGMVAGILFLAACGGLYLGIRLLTSKYGVSDEAPLGRLDKMDAHLASVGFRKVESIEAPGPKGALRAEVYEDPDTTMGDIHERVLLFVDGGGKVVAVGGLLAPNLDGMTPASFSRSNIFFKNFWEELAGAKPRFFSKYAAGGPIGPIAMPEIQEATLSTDRVEGAWSRPADAWASFVILHVKDLGGAPTLPQPAYEEPRPEMGPGPMEEYRDE